MTDGVRQFTIVFTCETFASSPEEALGIAKAQLETGNAFVEIHDESGLVQELDSLPNDTLKGVAAPYEKLGPN
jgi:hypothetical protein